MHLISLIFFGMSLIQITNTERGHSSMKRANTHHFGPRWAKSRDNFHIDSDDHIMSNNSLILLKVIFCSCRILFQTTFKCYFTNMLLKKHISKLLNFIYRKRNIEVIS